MKEKLEKLLEMADSLDLDGGRDIALFKTCSGYCSATIDQMDGVQYKVIKYHTGEMEFSKIENTKEKF